MSSGAGTTAIEVETTVDWEGDGDTRRDITAEDFPPAMEADIFGDNVIDSDSLA